jgi:hypothetical protein
VPDERCKWPNTPSCGLAVQNASRRTVGLRRIASVAGRINRLIANGSMASSRRLGINRGDPTAEVIRQLIPAARG